MKISVCIPTYNRVELLTQFVDKIPEEIQVCISDNGNYVKEDVFSRGNIKMTHEDKVVPPVTNWNKAISLVETEWFIIPGDDDFILPDMFSSVNDSINKYEDCGLIIYGYDIINGKGEVRKGWIPQDEQYMKVPASFYYMQRSIPFRWPSIVINTNKCREIGCLDTDFVCTASDSLFLQYMAIKYPIALIPKILGLYRVWGGSETSSRILTEEWFSELRLWQEKLRVLLNDADILYDSKKVGDQVFCDNLVTAFEMNKHLSIKDKISFLRKVGLPYNAGLKDILRLIKRIV